MNLASLDLTQEQLKAVREQVRHMAYLKWVQAGRPSGKSLSFWREAELEWVEYYYVPNRELSASYPLAAPSSAVRQPEAIAR